MDEVAQILLVDDEPDILIALEDLFETDYRVLKAGSGPEALEILAANPAIDVIVSDQRMPGMTGDVFLGRAREVSGAIAILLTGYADLGAVVAALNQGGIVGYAAKPWEPQGLRAMVAGAAKQRQLRRALAREQALLRGLMDHIPAEVAFKDRQGRYVQVNAHKARALQVSAEPDEGFTATDAEVLRTGQPVLTTVEQEAAAGPKWTETETFVITDAVGEVTHLAAISRDVTAQKTAESQLRQSEKLRALGTLAGGVAHDFNNLLTAILGSLELAGRKLGDDAAVRKYLDNAAKAANRGAALTQRLLGFSRPTESRAHLADLAAVLAGARDLMAQTLGSGVHVTWDIPDDLWSCMLEPDQLELALLNLGVNARDAMDGAGEIAISARNLTLKAADRSLDLAAGDYAILTVRDSGHGMTPETLGRVMEPFFTTKAPGKGTGLGLPMVYSFIKRSGGALDIASQVGAGTEVALYLPRGAQPAGSEPPAEPRRPVAQDRALCVLLVDDEAIVRDVTADFLRQQGHQVLQAGDGFTALKLFQADHDRIDLAVIDFAMPGMTGVDLAVAMHSRRPDLPIILLTGYFDLEAVPNDITVMHKPFSDAGLLEAISVVAAASSAPR